MSDRCSLEARDQVVAAGTDAIRITGIEVFAHHGVLPEEKENGQRFLIDIAFWFDSMRAGLSDDLTDTVDYGTLAQDVHDRVAGEAWNLIERVAERVAELVLERTMAYRAEVTVHKPQAPIQVPFGDVSVTIIRSR